MSRIKLNAYLSGDSDRPPTKRSNNKIKSTVNYLQISHEDGLSSLKDESMQQKREPSQVKFSLDEDHLAIDQSFHDEILGLTQNTFSRKKPSQQLSSKDYKDSTYKSVKESRQGLPPKPDRLVEPNLEIQRDPYSDHYFRDLILDQLLKEFQQPRYITSNYGLLEHENFNVKMVGHQFLGFRESSRIIVSAIDKPNYLEVFGIHGDTVLATNNSLSPKSDKSILNRNIRQETIQAFLNERRIYEDPFLKHDMTPELKSQKSQDSCNSQIKIQDENRNNSTISIEENPYEEADRTNENSGQALIPTLQSNSVPNDFSASLPDFSHEDIYYNHQNITQLSENGEGLLRNKKLDLIKEETSQKEYGSMFEATNSQNGSQLELKKTLESATQDMQPKKMSTLDYTKSFQKLPKKEESKTGKSPMQSSEPDDIVKTIDPSKAYLNQNQDEIKIMSSNHSKQSSWKYKKLQFTLESSVEMIEPKTASILKSSLNEEPKIEKGAKMSRQQAQQNDQSRRTENLRMIDSKNISVLINENQSSTQGTEVQAHQNIEDSQMMSDFILINQNTNSARSSTEQQETMRNVDLRSPKMPVIRETRQQSSKRKNQVAMSLNAIQLNPDALKQNMSIDQEEHIKTNDLQTLAQQATYTERNMNSQAKQLNQDSKDYKFPDKMESFVLEFEEITEVSKKDINRWGSKVLNQKTRVNDNSQPRKTSKSRSPPVLDSRNNKWVNDKSYQQSILQQSQMSKARDSAEGSKASMKTLNKIIDFAKNTRQNSKQQSRSKTKQKDKESEALKKILKNRDEINEVVDKANAKVFSKQRYSNATGAGKIDYMSMTSMNHKSANSFSPETRPQTQEKNKRSQKLAGGATGTTSQQLTGNKTLKDSTLFPTTQKTLKGISGNNRYERTRSNINKFGRNKASNMRSTKALQNVQRSTSQGRATRGSLNRLSVPNFRQIQEGLQVNDQRVAIPPGEDILMSPSATTGYSNHIQMMQSQLSKSQYNIPASNLTDFRDSYNQNLQKMLINSTRGKNKTSEKPREFLPDITKQPKGLNVKKNVYKNSQFSQDNMSIPKEPTSAGAYFINDANSTSTAMMNTNNSHMENNESNTEGLTMVNNQTYDLLNHHQITNFDSGRVRDSIDNEIVTVNIKRQKNINNQVANIENLMQSQNDQSLGSIFNAGNRGSPYKHMPDIVKYGQVLNSKRQTNLGPSNKSSVSALTSDITNAKAHTQLGQKKANPKFMKKSHKSPKMQSGLSQYQGKNTYRGGIMNTEVSHDGLNSTYINQSTRNVINYDYQLETARSQEKHNDFTQIVQMKKNQIQINPHNKARKPLKTQRPPKVGGHTSTKNEYFNGRKKSNYIDSQRNSMRNQGSLPGKSRNVAEKNSYNIMSKQNSSSNFRILAEAIDEQDKEIEQKYLMRKKTREMNEHLDRIKNTVNKSIVKELEEDFNSQVVTQDIDKQHNMFIEQNARDRSTDDNFNSNSQGITFQNSGTFSREQLNHLIQGNSNLLSFGKQQNDSMRKVLQQSKSNFNGTNKSQKKISGNMGANVVIKTKSYAHIPNKSIQKDQLLMSPNHIKTDSITSVKNIGGHPGLTSNHMNNPSHVTSAKLNIASLLSLQDPDPVKAALDRKSSRHDQALKSCDSKERLAEQLNPKSEYEDGANFAYNAQPNQ